MGAATRLRLLLVALAGAFALVPAASASQLVARDAQNVELKVNARNFALVTWTDTKGPHHLLAWGATNDQLEFKLDYSGGWKQVRKPLWKAFPNTCSAYDGPPLAWLVVACKARDGSYWALQSWQRSLPIFGRAPATALQRSWDLRLSHWIGDVPKLEVWQDWVYSVRLENLVARFTYNGKPVFGFKASKAGNPLDPYGRNVYFDAFDSAYGEGWHRANGLLTHNPTGLVCAAFADSSFLADNPAVNHGRGARYRATVAGPGVAPDAYWEGDSIGNYDDRNPAHAQRDAEVNAMIDSLGETDSRCTTD
jgi:hypothetical protein